MGPGEIKTKKKAGTRKSLPLKNLTVRLGGCPRMPFRPNSSELSKNNARNIKHMAVLIFRKFFDFEQNAYSRTAS